MPSSPLPNFLIAGATRSGTATLHQLLRAHPQIFMPERKELHFFDRDAEFTKGLDHYRNQFRKARGEARVGEATPGYLHANLVRDHSDRLYFSARDSCMARIARSLPDVRLIVSLRNPMARLRSNYTKTLLQRKATQSELDAVLRAELEGKAGPPARLHLLYSSRYDIHIAEMFAHIPRERVQFLIFEEWTHNVAPALAAIQRFLGVEELAAEPAAPRQYNGVENYRRGIRGLLQKLAGKKPTKDTSNADTLPSELDARLNAALQDSIAATQSLIALDLTCWTAPNPRNRASEPPSTIIADAGNHVPVARPD